MQPKSLRSVIATLAASVISLIVIPSNCQSKPHPSALNHKAYPIEYETDGFTHSWGWSYKKGNYASITINASQLTPAVVSHKTQVPAGKRISGLEVQHYIDIIRLDPFQKEWRQIAAAIVQEAERLEVPADELVISFVQSFPYVTGPPRYPSLSLLNHRSADCEATTMMAALLLRLIYEEDSQQKHILTWRDASGRKLWSPFAFFQTPGHVTLMLPARTDRKTPLRRKGKFSQTVVPGEDLARFSKYWAFPIDIDINRGTLKTALLRYDHVETGGQFFLIGEGSAKAHRWIEKGEARFYPYVDGFR